MKRAIMKVTCKKRKESSQLRIDLHNENVPEGGVPWTTEHSVMLDKQDKVRDGSVFRRGHIGILIMTTTFRKELLQLELPLRQVELLSSFVALPTPLSYTYKGNFDALDTLYVEGNLSQLRWNCERYGDARALEAFLNKPTEINDGIAHSFVQKLYLIKFSRSYTCPVGSVPWRLPNGKTHL